MTANKGARMGRVTMLTVRLRPGLRERLHAYAAQEGMSATTVIERFIRTLPDVEGQRGQGDGKADGRSEPAGP